MATNLVQGLGVQAIVKKQPVDLFTGDSFEITNAFQDISGVINVKGARSVVLWCNYDRGDSVDMQIKALVGADEDNVDYEFVIESVSTDKIEVDDEVIEAPDSDLKFVREFILNGAINYIKFQCKDSADGTGQLDAVRLSVSLVG